MNDLTPELAWDVLADRLREAKQDHAEESEVFENPVCRHCDHEMDMGSLEGGEVTFSCYRDDCPYNQENIVCWRITRSTSGVEESRHIYESILDTIQQIARELHNRPHDPETCFWCNSEFTRDFQQELGVCEDCMYS
jgi:hypothetical protein